MKYLGVNNSNFNRQLMLDIPPIWENKSSVFELVDSDANVITRKVTFKKFSSIVHNGYRHTLIKMRDTIGEGATATVTYILVDFSAGKITEFRDTNCHEIVIKNREY